MAKRSNGADHPSDRIVRGGSVARKAGLGAVLTLEKFAATGREALCAVVRILGVAPTRRRDVPDELSGRKRASAGGELILVGFFVDMALLGQDVLIDGATVRFPEERGGPIGFEGELPSDPAYGVRPWVHFNEDGQYLQGLVVVGPTCPQGLAKRLAFCLEGAGVGEPESPATEATFAYAWRRALRGDDVPVSYQLIADARQALRAGFEARAALEASIAVEVAIKHRFRFELMATGLAPADADRKIKKLGGLHPTIVALAPLLSKKPPTTGNSATDGDFPGISAIRAARNSVAHTGQLPPAASAAQLLQEARVLIDTFSVDSWRP